MVAVAAEYHTIALGDIHVTYLPDGYMLFNPTTIFPTTTATDWQHYQHLLDANDQLLGSVGAYLIQSSSHTILIDTGYGPGSTEQDLFKAYGGRLLTSLKLAGVEPSAIDIVFFTHLHPDHMGWTGTTVNGERVLTFPNARHLVRTAEWHRFDDPAEDRTIVEDELKLLANHIELVKEGEHIIPEVTILATPGHTVGNSAPLIISGAERAIITGDIFHSVVQFDHPEWTNHLDSDLERSKHTREQMRHELAKPSTIGIGSHFSNSVFGQLVYTEGKLRWQSR